MDQLKRLQSELLEEERRKLAKRVQSEQEAQFTLKCQLEDKARIIEG